MTAPISIVMGSTSDLPIMQAARDTLETLGIEHELGIVSAHRTPERLYEYARDAQGRGVKVIVAGAGGAAHLPGMIASLSLLPVIGVPISATKLAGEDALLSIVQMPAGIPVATVAIDNATNAALLAAQILGTHDSTVQAALRKHRDGLRDTVLARASQYDV